MILSNAAGHSTTLNSRLGLPDVHPHFVKSSHPFLSCLCSAVAEGIAEQSQPLVVSPPLVYQLPQIDDCAAEMGVPEAPQMLAVLYCRLSYPGTAMSMWRDPGPQPFDHGGHLFFFIMIADQSEFTAVGFRSSRHLPQPPLLSPSTPQHAASAPSIAERSSLAAPVTHIFSRCSLGPP